MSAQRKYNSPDSLIRDARRCPYKNCNAPSPDPFQLNSIEMRFARPPIAGDISICGACGRFAIYDTILQLHLPDSATMARIENTPQLMDLQQRILHREGM